jgi:hypothetical protein
MSQKVDLTNDRKKAVDQGADWQRLTIFYPLVDLSAWQIKGEIRDNYLSMGGFLVGAFDFLPLEYKSVEVCGKLQMVTVIIPKLTYIATKAMGELWVSRGMVGRSPGEMPKLGKNNWVYDIELKQGQSVKKLIYGFLEMNLEVTE